MVGEEPYVVAYDRLFNYIGGWFPAIVYGLIGLLTTNIVLHDNIDRMGDNYHSYFDTRQTFDFIIVGAGSSGAVLANHLSKNYDVLLLEAGGEPFPLTYIPGVAVAMLNRPRIDWQFQTIPQNNSCFAMNGRRMNWPRGKGLGGSSNLNFMQYARGHKLDYEAWAEITGDERWKFDNLLPFFKRSENFLNEISQETEKFHGRDGLLQIKNPPYTGLADYFVRAGKDLGYEEIDVNAPYTQGFATIAYTQENGRRMSTYKAFIEPIRNKQRLYIYKFSNVHKVLLREADNEAYGVEYERHGMVKRAFATKEIILSAGAIGSPKILMLSGIGPKDHLESLGIQVKMDLPVGKNLQDHITAPIGPFIVDEPITLNVDRDVSTSSVYEFVEKGSGILSSTGIQATAFLATSHAKKQSGEIHPDLQWILLGAAINRRAEKEVEFAFNVEHGLLNEFLLPAKGKDSFQITVVVSRPESRGEILLAGKNPKLSPLINPNYYEKTRDMKTIVEGLEKALHFAENTTTFKNVGCRLNPRPFPLCKHVEFRSSDYWECFARSYSFTLFHPSGTCAMGRTRSVDTVVDSQLRVVGTKGLRVCDASVMPKIISSNTNAICIALGEVASDLILKTWENYL